MTPFDPTAPAAQKSWFRPVFVTLLVLVSLVLVAVLSTWSTIHRSTRARLDHAIADADRTDPAWRLDDLFPEVPRPHPEPNPADQVLRALDELPVNWLYAPADASEAEPTLSDILARLGLPPPNTALNAEQADFLAQELDTLAPAVTEARKLADLGEGRFDVIVAHNPFETLLPHAQESRHLARLLQLDAARHAQEGDLDAALDSIRAVLGTGRALGDEPIMITQLVRMAYEGMATATLERTLAQGEASDDALAVLQEQLAEESAQPLLLYAMRGERALYDDIYRKFQSGALGTNDLNAIVVGPNAPVDPIIRTMHQGEFYRHNHALTLEYLNRAVVIARLPLPEQQERWEELERELRLSRGILDRLKSVLSYYLVHPAVGGSRTHLRTRAQLNIAVVLIAAERYRLAHDAWPESVEALTPFLPNGPIPIDPYSGDPIRLLRLDDGLAAYSVGPDQTDNQARFHLRGRPEPGFDVGLRLWDLPQRRQPPEPVP